MATLTDSAQVSKARPILKWAGGKTQLLPDLVAHVPAEFAAYHEPFVGGGALFFELAALGRLGSAYLSDINPALIDVYLAVRDCVDDVIRLLKQYRHNETYFYKIRAKDPRKMGLAERAARIIYLNKTCYNGLFRENKSGQFNVPFGRYKNPTICDEPNLLAVSQILQRVDIDSRPFSSVLDVARPGDFVYFDPPYHPISSTASFTAYARNGFNEQDQIRLRDVFAELSQKGVQVMLSNSDMPFIRELYDGYTIARVYAARYVNSKASARGKVPEVIVCNYGNANSSTR